MLTVAQGPGDREIALPDSLVVRCRLTLDVASTPMSLEMVGEFRRQLRWADIVHYHFPWPFAELLHLLFGRGRPSLVTYHSDIYRQRLLKFGYAPLMHGFLNRVDRIVATSANYLDTSIDLARHRERCRVVPIGLDEASYPAPPQDLTAQWEGKAGRGFFFFIGILRYYKGLDVLLEAARGAPFQVVIAGAGPLERELKHKAAGLGLDNVFFAGYVGDQDKAALFRLARAVVFPSLYRAEAFGVSLLEGAMFGLPLVSTEIGTGTSYVNENGVTGLVVPAGEAAALRAAMERLHGDELLCAAMGRAARKRFEQLFTADRMGEQYCSLYREVLDCRPGGQGR